MSMRGSCRFVLHTWMGEREVVARFAEAISFHTGDTIMGGIGGGPGGNCLCKGVGA